MVPGLPVRARSAGPEGLSFCPFGRRPRRRRGRRAGRRPGRRRPRCRPTAGPARGSTSSGEPADRGVGHAAGCSISDSTPPSDSASVNTRVARDDLERRGLAAASGERHHAAEVAHLLRGDLVAGVVGQARVEHPVDRGVRGEQLDDRAGRSRSARPCARASVLIPRSTSQQSNGAGTAPIAFWRNAEPLGQRVVVGDDDAADHVGVPAQVLRRRVHDDVGAERERLLEVRRGERVVDDDAARRRSCATAATAAMSTIASSGLVGVSIHTSFVVVAPSRRDRAEVVRSPA